MVSRDDLKSIVILSYLKDEMLDKLLSIVDAMMFHEDETIFKEGDMAERFFMLKRGKILLEKRISDEITVSVGSVKAGFSFGWSSMLEGDAYKSDAISADTCEVFSFRREKIIRLLNEDHSMGYLLNQRLLQVVKKRLDHRTEQFLRAIEHHPDTKVLF